MTPAASLNSLKHFLGAGEGHRERERDAQHGSRCGARSLRALLRVMTWAEIKSQMPNRLSHPGAPETF